MNNHKTPPFPKRAVVTNGMPYGDKPLHFGHVGGGFIHSDIYARFLRDRIGKDNVIYVSGTDCYGAGIEVKYSKALENNFVGSIQDFVEQFHEIQKKSLESYNISLNLYATSAFGESGQKHKELSNWLFEVLYKNGYLRLEEIEQFFDEESQTVLNGRQVEGRCPVAKCKSEKAYADECEMGHQYSPRDLIAPKHVITGATPVLRAVKNWYFDLERFSEELKQQQEILADEGISRKFFLSNVADFLKPPTIIVKLAETQDFELLKEACSKMQTHKANLNEGDKSAVLTFESLQDRQHACEILREYNIRFRTGTTLVPFRLSGNVKWGIPVPVKENINDQTFWVWPESLWAPISFVQTYLQQKTGSSESWTDWWFNPDSKVYQFIGEDNIYFYAVAGIGLFMAMNQIAGRETVKNLPNIIPNRHVFYGNRKVSSSGNITPPSVDKLLEHYTSEQLRMHFAHMALQSNSVKFLPKAVMENETGFDATLAEGNILTNVFNRLVRSCFYTLQKYFDGKMPTVAVSQQAQESANTMIFEYDWAMYRFEYSKVIDLLDVYLREANKIWSASSKEVEKEAENNESLRANVVVDGFHVVRVATTLLHPFAPEGTDKVREYLCCGENLWDWAFINEPLTFFTDNFKFLEPRVDFFVKHSSQL